MSLILHIETSGPDAWVVLAERGQVLKSAYNQRQHDHAAFLHPAIHKLLEHTSRKISDLTAVAVCAGPGSYTGIRVGMAAAKGLCYSLSIPLITLSALEITAWALKEEWDPANQGLLPICYCPMIDARRMEVFTAVYNDSLEEILTPSALILEADSYVGILSSNKVVFSGTGAAKWQRLCVHENALFLSEQNRDRAMTGLSWLKFQRNELSDLTSTAPFYIKEFHNNSFAKVNS